MRILKFRAWDGMNGEMIYCDFNSRVKFILSDLYKAGKVMQFTGIKDRNGKDIYEGDVLLWKPREIDSVSGVFPSEKSKVIFKNGCFCLKVKGHEPESFDYNSDDIKNNVMVFDEVIGNIYQNPDWIRKGIAEATP